MHLSMIKVGVMPMAPGFRAIFVRELPEPMGLGRIFPGLSFWIIKVVRDGNLHWIVNATIKAKVSRPSGPSMMNHNLAVKQIMLVCLGILVARTGVWLATRKGFILRELPLRLNPCRQFFV